MPPPPPDAIIGYHLNPLTCGVALFNWRLATHLHVPIVPFRDAPYERGFSRPCWSWRWDELGEGDTEALRALSRWAPTYLMWLHDWPGSPSTLDYVRHADARMVTNHALAHQAQEAGLLAQLVWCPSLLPPAPPRPWRVLVFGMAHKFQPERHRILAQRLPMTAQISISYGIHEGEPLPTPAFMMQLEQIYPHSIAWMGSVSAQGLLTLMNEMDYCAFMPREGARANHTTIQAALSRGMAILTTLDAYSPPAWRGAVVDLANPAASIPAPGSPEYFQLRAAAAVVGRESTWLHLLNTLAWPSPVSSTSALIASPTTGRVM